MKIEFLLFVCLIFVTITNCENSEESLEFQILKELTQEDKKCIKTAGEVIFILDGSTSVGPDNFNKEKDFATQIVNRLVIGNNLTRVALITYNSVPLLVFNVDKYNNSKDVNREILKAEFTEGITVVGDALNMVLQDIDKKTRRSTGKVIILISDGKRNGGMDPILVAKQLKALSYMIITIGLDKETDENSMIAISDKKNFYLIKDFDSLPKIVSTIVQKTCTEFHISKCSKPIIKNGPCVSKEQTNIITTFYYVNGKCVSENRKLTVKCLGPKDCPDPYYQKISCGSANHSFILFHNFSRVNDLCRTETVNVKKYACGCQKSEESVLKVVYGKVCDNGYRKRMLLYYEFNQFKCSETYLNLEPVKCAILCNGTTLVTSPCVNGKRNNTIYKKVFTNNTCSLKIDKTTESFCDTTCPKSLIIESKECVNNAKDVFHITFQNVNGKCIKQTKKIKSINCTKIHDCPQPRFLYSNCVDGKRNLMKISYRLVEGKCQEINERIGNRNCSNPNKTKCPKPSYKVEKCENNQKNTSLIRIAYRQINSTCVKTQKTVTKLPCQCYRNTETNVTVTFGRQCQNGFLSRVVELNVEKNGKCSKVAFKLRSIRCRKPCDRRKKVVVGKCKANRRSVTVLRAVREKNRCAWKTVTSKFVKCKNICPAPKEKRSRCILKKQAIFRVTFKEVGDKCRFNVVRLSVVPCQGCQNSTYRIEKCDKNAKETKLIRTFYQEINRTCIKKEITVKKLSCRCTGNTTKNINVVVGKQCQNGYITRVLELTEERNDKCVKVSFKLRRIRCQRPCSRRLKLVVNKCVSNKRLIQRMKSVKEGNKCVLKVVNSKTVSCKNLCPLPKERRTRCIKGMQGVMKISFNLVGDKCIALFVRVNVTRCQKCPRSVYRVDKCEKNSKETFLIRTFFQPINGICQKKEQKLKALPCKCYDNVSRNLSVVIGKSCQNGYKSKVLELTIEKNQKCIKETFKLRSIKCEGACNRTQQIVGPCFLNKRLIKVLKQTKNNNGSCHWKLLSTTSVNCSHKCPDPKTTTTSCVNGERFMVRVSYQEIGGKCEKREQKLQTLKCQKCFRKSVYELMECSKTSKTSELIRISHRNCTRKVEKLLDVDCSCERLNNYGLNVTSTASCTNGVRGKTLSFYTTINGKCQVKSLSLKGGKCGCFGSTYNFSVCINGKRTLERFTRSQVGSQCLSKKVSSRNISCKSVCPINSVVLTRKCFKNRKLQVVSLFERFSNQCKLEKFSFRWTKCINPIDGQTCSKVQRLTLSTCQNGKAFVIYTKSAEKPVNGNCALNSSKIAQVNCTDKCERTIRPKLVAGVCEKQVQLVFFIASRQQGKQCLHKINYLGKIGCKNC